MIPSVLVEIDKRDVVGNRNTSEIDVRICVENKRTSARQGGNIRPDDEINIIELHAAIDGHVVEGAAALAEMKNRIRERDVSRSSSTAVAAFSEIENHVREIERSAVVECVIEN